MSFLSSMNISASGLTAQRARFDIISENIANSETTRTERGGAYRRKLPVFESIEPRSSFRSILSGKMGSSNVGGVRMDEIVEDQRPFKLVYDPSHPDANEQGYVEMPNVDVFREIIDSMAATRAYDANATAFQATKLMAAKALEIGR